MPGWQPDAAAHHRPNGTFTLKIPKCPFLHWMSPIDVRCAAGGQATVLSRGRSGPKCHPSRRPPRISCNCRRAHRGYERCQVWKALMQGTHRRDTRTPDSRPSGGNGMKFAYYRLRYFKPADCFLSLKVRIVILRHRVPCTKSPSGSSGQIPVFVAFKGFLRMSTVSPEYALFQLESGDILKEVISLWRGVRISLPGPQPKFSGWCRV